MLDPQDAARLDGEDRPGAGAGTARRAKKEREEKRENASGKEGAPAHRAWLETETGRGDAASCAALAARRSAMLRVRRFMKGLTPGGPGGARADAERSGGRRRAGDGPPARDGEVTRCRCAPLVAWSTAELALRAGRLGEAEAEARIADGLGGAGWSRRRRRGARARARGARRAGGGSRGTRARGRDCATRALGCGSPRATTRPRRRRRARSAGAASRTAGATRPGLWDRRSRWRWPTSGGSARRTRRGRGDRAARA